MKSNNNTHLIKSRLQTKRKLLFTAGISTLVLSVIFACLTLNETNDYKLEPEYNQSLEKVIFSLSTSDLNLDLHDGLLSSLPEYTKIYLLVPESSVQNISSELKEKPYAVKTELISYKTEEAAHQQFAFYEKAKNGFTFVTKDHLLLPQGTKWTRDSFKSLINSKGQSQLYLSVMNKGFYCAHPEKQEKKIYIQDNKYIDKLSEKGFKIQHGSLFFEGGNILAGTINGKKLAFVGSDTLRETNATRKYLPDAIPEEQEIKTTLQQNFGVDDVIFVGLAAQKQPEKMFHLDQTMLFLNDGIVGLSHIVWTKAVDATEQKLINEMKQFLLETHDLLITLGFKVFNVDMTVHNALNYEQYVNAIPYTNIKTKHKEILMPCFDSNQAENENEVRHKNISLFRSLGYDVVQVPVTTTELHGGIHCLINVIG